MTHTHLSLKLLPLAAVLAGGIHLSTAATYQEEVAADNPVRYWQFEETEGPSTLSGASGLNTDEASLTASLQGGEFTGTTPGLLASQSGARALALSAENFQYLLVPSTTDINTGEPYPKKTIELWIKPASVPAPDINGAETAGLWEEGGADRGINLYLWHNPESADPDSASLVFHSFNRLADGPGTPYGLDALPALFAEYPGIKAGQVYHIVAVLDGDATGTAGHLILYVNGLEVGRAAGAGQIYAHGSDVRIGQGNGRTHTNVNGDLGSFDGIIDEVSYYNTALPADRVQAHYFTGKGSSGTGSVTIGAASGLAAKTVNEGTAAAFSVVAEGEGPFTFQWFRNGTLIEGQISSTLNLTGKVSDAGSYTVKVSNQTDSATGGPAVLTVVADTAAPTVLASKALAGGINQIILDFSEPLDPVSAASPASYSIGGLTVNAVTVSADGRRVTLHTAAQTPGAAYALTFTGVKDRSAAGNAPASPVTVTSTADYPDIVLADSPVRYWRFEETEPDPSTGQVVAASLAPSTGDAASLLAAFSSLDERLPQLGVPGLLGSSPAGAAVSLLREAGQWALVPTHVDVNNGVRAKRTVEVWFRADSVPAPDTAGGEAIAGIWEEGGTSRSLNLYLWRDPANPDPDEAELVFHAFNNAADGPGSPWGLPGTTPIWTHHTIKRGQTYHVAGVLDGDSAGVSGSLVLYVNGAAVSRAGGVGTLYAHGSDVRIGQGNSWYHEGTTGDVGSFDGVLDELAVYNTALPGTRVQSHYFTGSDLAKVDTDGDGLPNDYETAHGFNPNNPADAAQDADGDGLSNLLEFQRGTNPKAADTDGDGLSDSVETGTGVWVSATNTGTSPFIADSDGDGLPDGVEDPGKPSTGPTQTGSDPNKADTDGDYFGDASEVAAGSNPNDAASTPNGLKIEVLGTGTAALLGRDLTDPEDDIDDSAGGEGAGFNWLSATSGGLPALFDGEGALNVFDNRLGTGTDKWCCAGAPQDLTVEFATPVSLTHFTVSSANDVPTRDPNVWGIYGSHDNETFTPIAEFSGTKSLWKQRLQVVRFTLGAPAPAYKFIRYEVTETSGVNAHQIGEIEYFGAAPSSAEPGFGITGLIRNAVNGNLTLTWTSTPGKTYNIQYSEDPGAFTGDLGVNLPAVSATTTHTFANPRPSASRLYFRVRQQ